jgi:phage terminase small subunit
MATKKILNGLTVKQYKFVQEYTKSGNGTQSALKTYNVKNRKIAQSLASDNLSKPIIRKSIEEVLQDSGYKTSDSINTLTSIQRNGKDKKLSASDSIRATELLLKLEGKLVDRKQVSKLNINIETADKIKLLKLKEKYNKLLNVK